MVNRDIRNDFIYDPYDYEAILGQGSFSEVRKLKSKEEDQQGVVRCVRTIRWHEIKAKDEFE
jgi:hypothetical protein